MKDRRTQCTVVVLTMLASFGLATASPGGPLEDGPVAIQVAQGATVILDRTPVSGHDLFAVPATAGQILLLELNACCAKCIKTEFDKADEVRVVPAKAKDSQALASSLPSDQLPWYWMSVLPNSDLYYVSVHRPSRKRYSLRVTLMAAHDPRLDPGISVDRVSMNKDLLPKGQTLELKPYEPESFCELSDAWPAHLSSEGLGFELQIMSLDGLKKAWWGNPGGQEEISRLEVALRDSEAPSTPPLAVFEDAALAYRGKLEIVESGSWRGVRWIAAYRQDRGPVDNPLRYIIEGISRDGRYFILISHGVEYLSPPKDLSHLSDVEIMRLDDANRFRSFQQRVNSALNAAPADSFKPSLIELGAATGSLELR